MTTLTCEQCGRAYERRTAEINQAHKRGQQSRFCSRECAWAGRGARREVIHSSCRKCGKDFSRLSNGKRERALFCSRECAGTARNPDSPEWYGQVCALCGGPKSWNGRRCQTCRRTPEQAAIGARTLGELRAQYNVNQYHAKIRGLARDLYKGPKRCAACGYGLHVDICHIRDVASFPMDATLAEVNAPGNLIALDKRCHWEFDHGYLELVNGEFHKHNV